MVGFAPGFAQNSPNRRAEICYRSKSRYDRIGIINLWMPVAAEGSGCCRLLTENPRNGGLQVSFVIGKCSDVL